MWNIKIWHKGTYPQNRNRPTDIENKLVVAKGEGGGGGMDWEIGFSRYKLLYMEGINNKVLLCSTENYIQCPMINHNVKEYFKKVLKKEVRYIYIYIYTHIYTMEYYSAIKKNKVMPFTATWMDQEIIILSKVSWRQTNII